MAVIRLGQGLRSNGMSRLARAGLALASAATLLAACAQAPDPGRGRGEGDAGLAAFDRAHPECQLWTNWRKICSRTGPDGKAACVDDPGRPAAPSAPFCVYSHGDVNLPDLGAPDSGSLSRFCAEEAVVSRSSAEGAGDDRAIRRCRRFKRDRPFDGQRLAARLHPWCSEWSDARTERPVCRADGASGRVPGCSALAAKGYRHPYPLYCSRWQAPDWCQEPRDMLDRPDPGPDGIVLDDRRYTRSDGLPVHGTLCRRRR